MLQSFRDNTQSIIVKIIVGFIIVTFALFGVDSLVGLAGRAAAPITVNGVDIGEAQISEGIDMQRRQLLSQMGENADPSLLDDNLLRGAVIQNLIDRELLRQAAEQHGLKVSDQYLDSSILATREFQVEGQFDRNQFEALLRNVGMSPMMYRDYLRNETLLSQGRDALLASSFVLKGELDKISQLDQQKRNFKYLEVSIADVKGSIEVNEVVVKAYYDANSTQFKSDEQISLSYVELSKRAIAESIVIEETELQSQYERFVVDYEGEEARKAAHILIVVNDQTDESQALAKVLDIIKQIDAGKDFSTAAKEFSEDPGSAEDGGNLGVVEQGVMVPEFEEALFALNVGQISEPIRTDFGYHLIQLNAIEGTEAPAFESLRSQLEMEQKLQKAETEFVAQSEQLDDLRFSSSDLQEVSDVLKLEIRETSLFGREGGEDSLTQAPRFLAAAFSDEVLAKGENSELIELGDERIVVVHLKEHKPVRNLDLSDVTEKIKQQIKQQQASDLVKTQAQALLSKAEKEGLQSVETAAMPWVSHADVGRGGSDLSPEVVTALFKMAKPADGSVSYAVVGLSDGSAGVIALDAVSKGAVEFDDAELKGMADLLAGRLGQHDYRNLLANLKATAVIERL
ncbi:MAG: SurA N-terminal domain-containing protein [Motiliproteus sp.]